MTDLNLTDLELDSNTKLIFVFLSTAFNLLGLRWTIWKSLYTCTQVAVNLLKLDSSGCSILGLWYNTNFAWRVYHFTFSCDIMSLFLVFLVYMNNWEYSSVKKLIRCWLFLTYLLDIEFLGRIFLLLIGHWNSYLCGITVKQDVGLDYLQEVFNPHSSSYLGHW